jgi:hypothetical protein
MSLLLPKPLVEEIREFRDRVEPKIYTMVCGLIMELDDIDLINDQMCLSAPENDTDEMDLEWPNYGLFFDVEKNKELNRPGDVVFRVHHPRTKTLVRVTNYEAAKAVLISILNQALDKNDPHDPYKRTLRTTGNSVECIRGDPI